MAASSSLPSRRLLLTLAGVAVATLGVVGLLLSQPRSTVVEIQALVSQFELTALPPGLQRGEAGPAALETYELLAPKLRSRRLDLTGADRIEAYFSAGGRTALDPGQENPVRVSADKPFQTVLHGFGVTRLAIEAAGRDRQGGPAVRVALPASDSAQGRWTSAVTPESELVVELRREDAPEPERRTVPAEGADLVAAGGGRRAVLGLSLLPRSPASTLLRLIDPATGHVDETRLGFSSSGAQLLAWGNRLALLQPDPGETGPQPLLRPNLPIVQPRFYRDDRLEKQSFLLGGKVRFPGGEKEPLDLEPGFLLSLAEKANEPLTLRSLALDDGRLSLVLWGRASHLALGPTPELQEEELPSLFLWIYTHKLRALVYSTLASVLGLSLGLIKMFGLFKE